MFTDHSEYELFDYRLKCKKELLEFSEVAQNCLYVRIINLFYDYQLFSSFYNVNLKKYLTDEDIAQLLNIFSKKINKLYFEGKYYKRFETSCYGYPLVYLKQSNFTKIKRYFKYIMNLTTQKDFIDMICIIMTDLKSDFMGDDYKPTNSIQQFEILKSKLVLE